MKPTELLIKEHRVIEVVLDCLVKIIEQGISLHRLNFLRTEEAIDFFRNYADKWHHKKEEDHLFNMVESKNEKQGNEHIQDLKSEHEKNRGFVKGMDASFREAAHGDMKELMEFAKNAREYIDVIKGHIIKEDRIVFPYADEILSSHDQMKLEIAFKETEETDVDNNTNEKYIEIAKKLAMVYNVPEEIDKIWEENK